LGAGLTPGMRASTYSTAGSSKNMGSPSWFATWNSQVEDEEEEEAAAMVIQAEPRLMRTAVHSCPR
jgi:hypothetical protein